MNAGGSHPHDDRGLPRSNQSAVFHLAFNSRGSVLPDQTNEVMEAVSGAANL